MTLFARLSFVLFFLVSMKAGLTQPPAIQWQKSYGGTGADEAFSIQETSDGGYIIAGQSMSNNIDVSGNHGMFDYWIVKTNSTGTIQWQKSFGGTSNDVAKSILQTNDGGYIVTGSTYSINGDVTGNHGNGDYWVIKLSGAGAVEWKKCYGGSNTDDAFSIRKTSDGGYIVAGSTFSPNDGDVTGNHGSWDYWILKINSIGTLLWQKTYGGSSADNASSIGETTDGGFIISGLSHSIDGDVTGNNGNDDYWVVKISSSGSLEWQKSLGGSSVDHAYSVLQALDGGYVIAGGTNSNNVNVSGNHGMEDYWVVKLSSLGTIQWQKCLGGSSDDRAYSISLARDGGYIVAGATSSNNGDITGNHGFSDYWIVKLGNAGDIQWQKAIGGSGSEFAYSIMPASDGGYIISGYSGSNDGDATVHQGFGDYWIVKLVGILTPVTTISSNGNIGLQISPNPSENMINVSGKKIKCLIVYDINGKVMIKNNYQAVGNCIIDVSNFSTGIYYMEGFDVKMNRQVQKFIKL